MGRGGPATSLASGHLSKIQIGRNLDHRPTRGNDGLSIDQVAGLVVGHFTAGRLPLTLERTRVE
jgi:hypothetical protein